MNRNTFKTFVLLAGLAGVLVLIGSLFVLGFVGVKLLLINVYTVPTWVSLSVIVAILTVACALTQGERSWVRRASASGR